MIALLAQQNVPVEAGLSSVEDARRFAAEIDPDSCLRILIEMPDVPGDEAVAQSDHVLD